MAVPELFVPSISTTLLITAAAAVAYVLLGALRDAADARRRATVGNLEQQLAIVLFGSDLDAAHAAERLASSSRGLLLSVVQRLASKLDGQADVRLRSLVSSAGLTRSIRSRLDSRSWRRRSQGASLASLLPEGDPLRVALLDDPHPQVRARAAESLERVDAVHSAERLIELLDDDIEAVRFAAQQALLLADSRVVPSLVRYLETADGRGVVWALEAAANLPDVRLARAVERHTTSADPRRRSMAIDAMVPWLDDPGRLVDLFADADPGVRATAARAAGSAAAEILAAHVGRLLSDEAWEVRLGAGQALTMMGPTGLMTLRVHEDDSDPYAADMASFMLDSVEARTRALPGRGTQTAVETDAA